MLLLTDLHDMHRSGYLSELPEREYLPMFWTEEELGLLQGTTVAQNATVSSQPDCLSW